MVQRAAGLVQPWLAEQMLQMMTAAPQYGLLVLQVDWLVVVQLAEIELG